MKVDVGGAGIRTDENQTVPPSTYRIYYNQEENTGKVMKRNQGMAGTI
jgi:hypothetical protein